jgi:uncharacterized membrane protein YhdT
MHSLTFDSACYTKPILYTIVLSSCIGYSLTFDSACYTKPILYTIVLSSCIGYSLTFDSACYTKPILYINVLSLHFWVEQMGKKLHKLSWLANDSHHRDHILYSRWKKVFYYSIFTCSSICVLSTFMSAYFISIFDQKKHFSKISGDNPLFF